jgi:hypothetical protein
VDRALRRVMRAIAGSAGIQASSAERSIHRRFAKRTYSFSFPILVVWE